MTINRRAVAILFVLLLTTGALFAFANETSLPDPPAKDSVAPDLRELIAVPQSELRGVVQLYDADRGSLNRAYPVTASPTSQMRLKHFYSEWLAALGKLDPDKLSKEGAADYTTLKDNVRRELRDLDRRAKTQAEVAPLVPFAATIINLEEARRRMEKIDSAKAADILNNLKKQIEQTRHAVETGLKADDKGPSIKATKNQATHAAEAVVSLRTNLKNWFGFYNGYDPLFTWWMAEPYKDVDAALQNYATFLQDKVAKMAGDDKAATPDAKDPEPVPPRKVADVPDLKVLIAEPQSEMRGVIQRYQTDRGNLSRLTSFPGAPVPPPRSREQLDRLKKFYTDWLAALKLLDFDKLSPDGRLDYLLLRNQLVREHARLDLQVKTRDEIARLVPFEAKILELDQARRRKEKPDAAKALDVLDGLKKEIDEVRKAVEGPGALKPAKESASTAVRSLDDLRSSLRVWFDQASGVDPKFAETAGTSYKAVSAGLEEYTAFLKEKVVGPAKDPSSLPGTPIGRDALLVELAGEMIPYTPEELIDIANKEMAWCEGEMKKASNEMGFGDDWLKAVEKVKTLHVEPGKQPEMIRDLAFEAIDYVRKHDLVTVPPIAAETWRMEMMTPQRQLVNPFFTGGEVISVSFPTNTMSHEAKLQSLRGNNIHFSRATVHHELIPGHHLQLFMNARNHTYRAPFGTPFWLEGWAVYWEMLLYDRGFVKTPEDRVGMMFWRMHRCARIIFSLNFHLGKMSPEECVDFLVKRVGHERDNATAEVRRSFNGSYVPLYQAGYLLGALEFWALHKELVDSGKMTDRAFHDAILKESNIPVALVRARLSEQILTPDFKADWKFYEPNRGAKK